MTSIPPPPPALTQLVQLLQSGQPASAEQLRQAIAAVAQWRLACGDLQEATRWQQLALGSDPPNGLHRQLQPLLQPLLQTQPELKAALQQPKDWQPLQRALQRGHYTVAEELQRALLSGEPTPPDDPQLLVPLLQGWLQAGRWPAALQLLHGGEALGLTPALVCDAQIARCVCWLLLQKGNNGAVGQNGSLESAIQAWQQRCLELGCCMPET